MSQHTSGDGLLLPGLDGTNPLGFLAALGLLGCLSRTGQRTSIRLGWTQSHSTWIPRITFDQNAPATQELLLEDLEKILLTNRLEHPANLYQELQTACDSRREFFEQVLAGASVHQRLRVDFLAAIASDATPDDAVSQIQTTRRDYHLGNIDSILKNTRREHLQRAVFNPWVYSDSLDNQSLHLDPTEDRRHAYQWNKPSGDPSRKRSGGVLGANRLAIEAIALLTSFPNKAKLKTLGFQGDRSTNTVWTWPIWIPSVSIETVKTLLGLEELQNEEIDRESRNRLNEYGVAAAYRTQRILVEKTPNFTPPYRVS
jgi:CRISPR-associated endonuclease/helicase Cas3